MRVDFFETGQVVIGGFVVGGIKILSDVDTKNATEAAMLIDSVAA